MASPLAVGLGIFIGFFLIPGFVLIGTSVKSVHQTEWALDLNSITMHIDKKNVYEAGLHWIWTGHTFVRFPNTWQNVEFSTSEDDLLHSRTSDGLPLTLGLSFQYTIQKDKLYDLYMTYKDQYPNVLYNVASDIIGNLASEYTAYSFFNDKHKIAIHMEKAINTYLEDKMFMNVNALQIILIHLPTSFEDSILESINTKQNITKMEKLKQTNLVNYKTELLAATKEANQTVTEAHGTATAIKQTQVANGKAIKANLAAEMVGYSHIKDKLGFAGDDLLEYMWYDSLSEQQGASNYIVGMNPMTFISKT